MEAINCAGTAQKRFEWYGMRSDHCADSGWRLDSVRESAELLFHSAP